MNPADLPTWRVVTPDGRTVVWAWTRDLAQCIVSVVLPGHRVEGPDEGRTEPPPSLLSK